MKKKTNPKAIEIIKKLKKTNPEVAKLLARPIKKQIKINLEQIKEKEDVLIPGKVLGDGTLNNGIKIVALSATKSAIEKIDTAKGEFIKISEEIKKNPELKNLKLIRWVKK